MALDKNSVPVASRTGSVTIQAKIGTPGTYTDIGCLVGEVALARSWANNASEETDVWCINQDGSVSIAPYEAGAMTGTFTLTLEAILSDAVYQFLRGNTPDTPFDIQFLLTDALTNVTTETLEYRVVKVSDTLSIRAERGATTRYSLDLQIVEILEEDIETAA